MMAMLAESPLSPDRPTQTVWRGKRRPDGWARGSGGLGVRTTSRQPWVRSKTGTGGVFRIENVGLTASRCMRTDDDTKRGDARARPEDIKGVIPGAVDVAD
jgi:hypothetical protein